MVVLKIGEREVKLSIILRVLCIHHFMVSPIAKYLIAAEVSKILWGVVNFAEKPRNRRGSNRGYHYSEEGQNEVGKVAGSYHWLGACPGR